MRRTLLALVIAGCVHDPATASRSVTPEQAAAIIKERAERAHATKRYADSFALYSEAYALEPLPATAIRIATAAAQVGRVDEAFTWLHTAIDGGFTAVSWLKDPDFGPLQNDPRWAKLPARIKPRAEANAKALEVGGGLVRATPKEVGIDDGALQALVQRAEKARTTGLVVLKDGKLVGDWYFAEWSRPTDTMGATSAVLALGVGFLLDSQKLESVDAPLWHFFPELKQGQKERLTVRHLLTHSSGIHDDGKDLTRVTDLMGFALAADLDAEPGTRTRYNEKALALLAGVIERAGGQKADDYLKERLFAPLGIRDVYWTRDRGQNPLAPSGLQLHPLDLAKVGQLVLDKGAWRGKQLVPSGFVDQGHGWELSYEKVLFEVQAGTSRSLKNAEWARAVKAVEGTPLSREELWSRLVAIADKDAFFAQLTETGALKRTVAGPVKSLEVMPKKGQRLIIMPAERLIVVRLSDDDEADPFDDLPAFVSKLTTKN
ncbi:MAG: serine hydrolase [Myxococcaceae bacterium]|nr:serine hydrolase [Myxococcaceae bacterium]